MEFINNLENNGCSLFFTKLLRRDIWQVKIQISVDLISEPQTFGQRFNFGVSTPLAVPLLYSQCIGDIVDSASYGSNFSQANIYVGGLTSSFFQPQYVIRDNDLITCEIDMRPDKNTIHFFRNRVQIPAVINYVPSDPGVYVGYSVKHLSCRVLFVSYLRIKSPTIASYIISSSYNFNSRREDIKIRRNKNKRGSYGMRCGKRRR